MIQFLTKGRVGTLIYKMKCAHESVIVERGEVVTIDELLTQFYGRKVSELEGQRFITHDLKHA